MSRLRRFWDAEKSGKEENDEEMICDGKELAALIDRYVNGKKAERNREILKKYYLEGNTYEQTAEHFGMSPAQISRIVRRHGDPVLLMLKDGKK